LNEGFASYFEALWDEHKNGTQQFLYNMFEKSGGAREGLAKTRPVVDRRWHEEDEVFDSRAYPKGAWVLHMLRRRTGDETFFAALKHYCEAHRYGTVETVDLRRAFEEITGESFERFFYDWTERPGHPSFDVDYGWDEDHKLLEVTVKQTQQGEEFRCSPSLGIEEKAGGGFRDVELELDAKEKRFLFPLAARPSCVRFDAGEEVLSDLKEEKPEDWWLAQLERAQDVIGRIRAARHLAETRAPHLIEAVAKRMREDKEWMVQAESAEALGKAGGDAARDALLAALSLQHPKARHAVARGLGSFRRDEKVFAALLALVEKGDPSYTVESDAVASLARVAADDPQVAQARLVLDKVIAERPSHNESIRRAAIDGLAALGVADVLPSIQRWIPRGNDPQVRRTAMAAAARTAILPDATEKSRFELARMLAQSLDDGERRVLWSAIDALSVLGKDGSPGLAALQHVAQHDPEGRTRDRAKQAAEKIAAGTPPPMELARLREELARMHEREERLERRIERVEAKSGPSGTNGAKRF
jgi:aminopeptidase N